MFEEDKKNERVKREVRGGTVAKKWGEQKEAQKQIAPEK